MGREIGEGDDAPRPPALDTLIPAALRGAIGGRPLVGDEDVAAYDALLGATAAAVDPKDPIEWFFVKDIVDLVWEVQRLRRLQSATLHSAELDFALQQVLEPLAQASGVFESAAEFDATMAACRRGDERALATAKDALRRSGRDWSAVSARAFAARLPEVERFDSLISRSEAKCRAMLRELTRHREQPLALPGGRRPSDVMDVEVARDATTSKRVGT